MNHRESSGAGLLEFMISIFLSAFILVMLFRYTFFLEKTFNIASDSISLMEKYHVAYGWLVKDIEMAGYMGCVNARSRSTILDSQTYLSSNWLTMKDDTLKTQYMSPESFSILNWQDNQIFIEGHHHFHVDDIVVIETCWEAEVAKIQNISQKNNGSKTAISFYSPLKIDPMNDGYIGKLVQRKFFIKNTTRKNLAGEFIPSLYVEDINSQQEEVCENIRHFHFSINHSSVTLVLEDFKNNWIELLAEKYNVS